MYLLVLSVVVCCYVLLQVLLVLALCSEVSGGRRRYSRRKYGRKYNHRHHHRHCHSHHHTKEYYEPSYERQSGAHDAEFVSECVFMMQNLSSDSPSCECFWYSANVGVWGKIVIVIGVSLNVRVSSVSVSSAPL